MCKKADPFYVLCNKLLSLNQILNKITAKLFVMFNNISKLFNYVE